MQPVNPAAYTNAFPRVAVWVDTGGLEPLHICRRYRHGEISAPVLAEVQISATATHLGIHHRPSTIWKLPRSRQRSASGERIRYSGMAHRPTLAVLASASAA